MDTAGNDSRLDAQVAYYRAVAPEYDDGVERDRTELERPELLDELARFNPVGDVLELAGGTGIWTVELVRYASRLTVVDVSPETLAINRAKSATAAAPPIDFVVANLFDWEPPRQYDVVFFSYWLTHVPPDRFEDFWRLVGRALTPDGRVFFLDDAQPRLTPADHVERDDPDRGVSHRRLRDGRRYEIVKVYWRPDALERRLLTLSFDASVRHTGHGYCLVGHGVRRPG